MRCNLVTPVLFLGMATLSLSAPLPGSALGSPIPVHDISAIDTPAVSQITSAVTQASSGGSDEDDVSKNSSGGAHSNQNDQPSGCSRKRGEDGADGCANDLGFWGYSGGRHSCFWFICW